MLHMRLQPTIHMCIRAYSVYADAHVYMWINAHAYTCADSLECIYTLEVYIHSRRVYTRVCIWKGAHAHTCAYSL